MAKRAADDEDQVSKDTRDRRRSNHEPNGRDGDESGSDFEGEYEDEWDSDEEIIEAGADGLPDDEGEKKDVMDVDQQTFIVGRTRLEAGQKLEPDRSTYEMFHELGTTWPCLSFDFLRDGLGDERRTYPATVYAVAGTQAEAARARENEVMVMKMSGLSRMERDLEEDSDEEDSEDEQEDPILETKSLRLNSTVNRVRAQKLPSTNALHGPAVYSATMTEAAELIIHNITPHLDSFDNPGTVITPRQNQPSATLKMHRTEGYAVSWSPLLEHGQLLSGDNDGKIFLTAGTDGGQWKADTKPFTGHTSSVEDLQWSPNERNVFASASSDGTVKVWDTRAKSRRPAVDVTVSDTDVNVLSWSHKTWHLMATGADDGTWAVWDLRQWKPKTAGAAAHKPTPVASFDFHKEQITSVEWHPSDDSVVAVAAGDDTVTLWDVAVEFDDEESKDTGGVQGVPPQLLFVHYMEQAKECHWHPQVPGTLMATGMGTDEKAGGGRFGIFKTISV